MEPITKSLKNFLRIGLFSIIISIPVSAHAQTLVSSLNQPNTIGQYYNNVQITLNPGFSANGANGVFHAYITPGCAPLSSSPTQNQNYIITYTPRQAGFTNQSQLPVSDVCLVNQQIEYFDGLGRTIQHIEVKGSPGLRDIVDFQSYDLLGREAVKYLPYVVLPTVVSDGSFKTNAIADQLAFYNPSTLGASNIAPTHFPFTESKYDGSPLNRVREQGEVGDAWQLTGKTDAVNAGHTIKTSNLFNNTNQPADSRQASLYHAIINADGSRTLSWDINHPWYVANQLFVTILKDQNWSATQQYPKVGTTEKYFNKDMQLVLDRCFNYNVSTNTLETLSTYYVYDDLGNLCFILPAKAEADAGAVSQSTLDNLCYQYMYDDRQRMTGEKVPGKGWDFMIYNQLDQVVLTQDANKRNKTPQQWSFTKYDSEGRPAITGIFQDFGGFSDNNISAPGRTRLQILQNAINQQPTLWEVRNNSNSTTAFYSNNTFPIDNQSTAPNNNIVSYRKINYYDDYNIPNLPTQYNFASSSSNMTNGLATASLTNVIGTSDMLWSVNYYDDEGRTVRTILQHYLGGVTNVNNYDDISNTYDFNDQVTTATRNHYAATNGNAALAVNIVNNFEYDHLGRETKTWEQINGGANVLMLQRNYNELGQTSIRHLHSSDGGNTFLQNIAYTYNERGWLTKINDPQSVSNDKIFGMQLFYGDDNPNVNQRTYNGNVSSNTWQTKVPLGYGLSQIQQSFDFTYDNINRLTKANYTTPGQIGAFKEEVTYDKMDNILSLNRNANNAQIDQLIYTYQNSGQSNTLQNVVDNSGNNLGQLSGTTNYSYDNDGNQLTDDQKTINISYNYLNLPQTINQTSSGQTLNYIYDADGRKLRKILGGNTRDYINGIEYNNGTIEFIQTEEGRAVRGTTYTYEYKLEDYLGNTRAIIKQDGSITQVQDYLPFGMDMSANNGLVPSTPNNYKFNGAEIQPEFNLNKYDYGARHYDPAIARWSGIDPLAVFYHGGSPYSYTLGNPIRYSDDFGMGAIDRILAALKLVAAKPPYLQESDYLLRTGSTQAALAFMDCSEFVCRVLAADGVYNKVPRFTTLTFLTEFSNEKKWVKGDDNMPHVGDIAVWYGPEYDKQTKTWGTGGHIGIVEKVAPNGKFSLIGATNLKTKYPNESKMNYSGPTTFKGFYRPAVETRDGKISNQSSAENREKKSANVNQSANLTYLQFNSKNGLFNIMNTSNFSMYRNTKANGEPISPVERPNPLPEARQTKAITPDPQVLDTTLECNSCKLDH